MPVDKVTIQQITSNITQKATDNFYVSSSDAGYVSITASSGTSADISASHGLIVQTGPSGSQGFAASSSNSKTSGLAVFTGTGFTGNPSSKIEVTTNGWLLTNNSNTTSSLISQYIYLKPSSSLVGGVVIGDSNTTIVANNSILYSSGAAGLVRGISLPSSGSFVVSNGTTWASVGTSSITSGYALAAGSATASVDGNTDSRVIIARGTGNNISGALYLTYTNTDGLQVGSLNNAKYLTTGLIKALTGSNLTIENNNAEPYRDITIKAADKNGSIDGVNAGDIYLKGGDNYVLNRTPGAINIEAGYQKDDTNSSAKGGLVNIAGGRTVGKVGGDVFIRGGIADTFLIGTTKEGDVILGDPYPRYSEYNTLGGKLKINRPFSYSASSIRTEIFDNNSFVPSFPLMIVTGNTSFSVTKGIIKGNGVLLGQTLKIMCNLEQGNTLTLTKANTGDYSLLLPRSSGGSEFLTCSLRAGCFAEFIYVDIGNDRTGWFLSNTTGYLSI